MSKSRARTQPCARAGSACADSVGDKYVLEERSAARRPHRWPSNRARIVIFRDVSGPPAHGSAHRLRVLEVRQEQRPRPGRSHAPVTLPSIRNCCGSPVKNRTALSDMHRMYSRKFERLAELRRCGRVMVPLHTRERTLARVMGEVRTWSRWSSARESRSHRSELRIIGQCERR